MNIQGSKESKKYQCPNGTSKISSMWVVQEMSDVEQKNLILDLKMMTKHKVISASFSEHIINNIN